MRRVILCECTCFIVLLNRDCKAGSEDQACNHVTAFAHQDVISSAGGTGVHKINTDTLPNDIRININSREDQSAAGTDNNQFGVEG